MDIFRHVYLVFYFSFPLANYFFLSLFFFIYFFLFIHIRTYQGILFAPSTASGFILIFRFQQRLLTLYLRRIYFSFDFLWSWWSDVINLIRLFLLRLEISISFRHGQWLTSNRSKYHGCIIPRPEMMIIKLVPQYYTPGDQHLSEASSPQGAVSCDDIGVRFSILTTETATPNTQVCKAGFIKRILHLTSVPLRY